jgi:hypothetical protein
MMLPFMQEELCS